MAGILSHLPRAGKRPFVSLSVEGSDLRVLTLEGLRITRFVSRPLDPALLSDGVVSDPAAFGAAVRTILSEYEIPPGQVVAAFADACAEGRLLALPKKRGVSLADQVTQAASADPLLAADGLRLFHQIVDEHPEQAAVFVLGIRRAALAAYLAGLHSAGIEPIKVELRPLALARGVGQAHIVIAHAERTSLDVLVVKDDVPAVLRTVALAGDDPVSAIVSHVEQAIATYNSAWPVPLAAQTPVALTGELAGDSDLQAALHNTLGRAVASVTSPFEGPAGFNASTFVVNVGLLLGIL